MGQTQGKDGKSRGVLGFLADLLGLGDTFDDARSSTSALVTLPETLIKYLKWVAIGAAVLAAIFLIVTIWRYSRGKGPDVAAIAAAVAAATPAGQAASVIRR